MVRIGGMRRFLAFVVAAFACVPFTRGEETRQVPELAKAFAAERATGTFVLRERGKGTVLVHNLPRASERFVPASTFKIVNALIGLETEAVKDVDEVLPYGGKPQMVKEWEKDMSLRDGIRVSNVPVFQELARRIGLPRMRARVAEFRYGNGEVGNVVDRFWLDGPLKISAMEQTEFLERLVTRKLPVKAGNVAAVEEISRMENAGGATLHGKTGWQPPIGWWVGWVRRGDELATFAMNMELREMAEAGKRVRIGKECLRVLGWIPTAGETPSL